MTAKVLSNLESVGDMIGALAAISDGLEEKTYTEGLIHAAHSEAANAFDIAAAGAGGAGILSHVYEYGVSGITPGPPMFSDPAAPEARLWTHNITGTGGNQDIGFMFRPATVPNPTPTTATTGVSSQYLKRLSKKRYTFFNRAYVMETARPVSIKGNGLLFVPFYGKPSNNEKNNKGYMMWNSRALGPINMVPGQNTAGNFSAFWIGWWSGEGQDIMEMEMRRNVDRDIDAAMLEMQKRVKAHTMKPAAMTNIQRAKEAGKSVIDKMFGAVTKMHRKDIM